MVILVLRYQVNASKEDNLRITLSSDTNHRVVSSATEHSRVMKNHGLANLHVR